MAVSHPPRPQGPRLLTVLWTATALFVLYGGLIPFHFASDRAIVTGNLSRITFNPLISPDTGRRVSIPDVVQNIVMFVPFGAFGVLVLRTRRSTLIAIVSVTVLAATLSAAVEMLQLFEIDRTTSLSDVCANVIGAIAGAATAVATSRVTAVSISRFRPFGVVVPAFYPFATAAIVLFVAAWQPFDFTLDVGTLVGKLRAFYADPWQFVRVTDKGIEFTRYVLFGLTAALWLRQLRITRYVTWAAVGGVGIAFALEASQWIVASRMPGMEDAAVHAAGVVGGVALARDWPYDRSPAFWCGVLWMATAAGATLAMLNPVDVVATRRPLGGLPFGGYYERTTLETLSHMFETLLLFFPIGFSCRLTAVSSRRALAVALAGTLLIAAPLEYLQRWIAGRHADLTDVGMAILGAAVGLLAASAAAGRMRMLSDSLSGGSSK